MKDKVTKTKVTRPVTRKKAKEVTKVEEHDLPIRFSKKRPLLRNKTLIIGCGRLGASLAGKIAKEGKNVIVVDKFKSSFESLEDSFSGYQIVGDVLDLNTLENAYITSAQEIIITTGNDNVNIYLALLAREVFDVPSIFVRLDNPEMVCLLEDKDIEVILPFQLSYDKLDLMRGGK